MTLSIADSGVALELVDALALASGAVVIGVARQVTGLWARLGDDHGVAELDARCGSQEA